MILAKFKFNKKKGITLVELLIVVAIVTVLSLAIIPTYSDFSRKKDFNNKVETFVNEIMNVRNKALSGSAYIDSTGVARQSHWGVQPNCTATSNTSYTLGHKLTTTGSSYVSDITMPLPNGVTFAPGCSTLIFQRLKGTPESAGTITLSFNGLSRTISVNSSGRIIYTDSN